MNGRTDRQMNEQVQNIMLLASSQSTLACA